MWENFAAGSMACLVTRSPLPSLSLELWEECCLRNSGCEHAHVGGHSVAIHRQPNACSGCDAVCGDLLYRHLWRGDHGTIQYSGALENAPTAFDGYPMTRQGKSGKAVEQLFSVLAIGGVASALVMMAAPEPLANWAIRNIGPPEIFAFAFFGLAVASSVGGRSIWEAVMSRAAWSYHRNNRPRPCRGVSTAVLGFY